MADRRPRQKAHPKTKTAHVDAHEGSEIRVIRAIKNHRVARNRNIARRGRHLSHFFILFILFFFTNRSHADSDRFQIEIDPSFGIKSRARPKTKAASGRRWPEPDLAGERVRMWRGRVAAVAAGGDPAVRWTSGEVDRDGDGAGGSQRQRAKGDRPATGEGRRRGEARWRPGRSGKLPGARRRRRRVRAGEEKKI